MTRREAVRIVLHVEALKAKRAQELAELEQRLPRDPRFPDTLCVGANPPPNMIVPKR